jgi:glycosyltransferase involved in cell wall biosynthesis
MKIWILQTGEPLHIDNDNPRPMRAMNLSNKLVAAGHSVVLWSSAFSHQGKRHRTSEYTVHKVDKNLEIRLIPSCGYQRHIGFARLIDHSQLAWNLKKLLKKEKSVPDIAFIGYPPIETAAVMSKWLKARSVPMILDVKDLWPSMFIDALPSLLKPLAKITLYPYFYLAKRTIRDASSISSMAPLFLEWVLNFSNRIKTENDRVFRLTTPNDQISKEEALSATYWWEAQGVDLSKPLVIFVGSFMSVFDFNPVIKAAENLDNCQFVLCGSGDYIDSLKKKAGKMNNVYFPGWIDRSKIKVLAKNSLAALAPYKNIDNFMVNTPNKIVDALSLGLPILSPLRGEVKGLIDKYKIGFTYVDNLEKCIMKLIKDEKLQIALSKNSITLYKEQFDFNQVYDDFVIHMEKMANE